MSANRFLLSLVAALLLSTLATANSTDVTAFLHSGSSTFEHANASVGHFSTNVGTATPMTSGSFTSHLSGTDGNADIGAMFSGLGMEGKGLTDEKAGRIVFPSRKYGPTCCEARRGIGAGQGHAALSTPEPGSLMLLSTGLMGIAGMVWRKLRLV